jgi:hypothetical protein
MNVALFIDGLDEFQGPPSELLGLLKMLRGPNTKICVSSRPWPVFEDAFSQRPSLMMDRLTRGDIHNYVNAEFNRNPAFKPLRDLDEKGADSLVQEVIDKSQGVFLWVYLVGKLVSEALSDGEPLSELRRHVDSLPSELTLLFDNIVSSLRKDQTRFRKFTELVQLSQHAIVPLTVLQLSFAEEPDQEFAFQLPVRPLSRKEQDARAELCRRRISAYSKCLLEVRRRRYCPLGRSPVEFIHRTVGDYLRDDRSMFALNTVHDGNLDPNLRLCLSQIAWIKTLPTDIIWGKKDLEQYDEPARVGDGIVYEAMKRAMAYATRADPDYTGMQSRLLKEVNRAAVELTTVNYIARGALKNFEFESLSDGDGPAITWPCAHIECRDAASFLYLAHNQYLKQFVVENVEHVPQSCRRLYIRDIATHARGLSSPSMNSLASITDRPPRLLNWLDEGGPASNSETTEIQESQSDLPETDPTATALQEPQGTTDKPHHRLMSGLRNLLRKKGKEKSAKT